MMEDSKIFHRSWAIKFPQCLARKKKNSLNVYGLCCRWERGLWFPAEMLTGDGFQPISSWSLNMTRKAVGVKEKQNLWLFTLAGKHKNAIINSHISCIHFYYASEACWITFRLFWETQFTQSVVNVEEKAVFLANLTYAYFIMRWARSCLSRVFPLWYVRKTKDMYLKMKIILWK